MLLLDSNAFIWLLTRPERLSVGARTALASHNGPMAISLASIWEIEIKRSIGKLGFDGFSWSDQLFAGRLAIVDMTLDDILRATRLPPHHRDPFDRMLIAQALNRKAAIVTADNVFSAYGVPVIAA
jgi:PIN domain nuclease of toxin-antitoxin system